MTPTINPRQLARLAAFLMLLIPVIADQSLAAERPKATLYKNPQCSCCDEYAKYLRRNGFEVRVVSTHDLSLVKKQHGIAEKFEGCHTTLIDRYVVEGHVPVKTIDKLLTERPDILGISLPGMPEGSPGMTGRKTEPFTIYEIGNAAEPRVYAVE
jgi:hypothetical protein